MGCMLAAMAELERCEADDSRELDMCVMGVAGQ